MPVNRRSAHAVGDRRGGNCAAHNVVEQNVGESGFAVRRVERCKVDACINERLIGWGKERERSVALERFQQFRLDDGCNQRVVNACALSGAWNVVWRCGWGEHLIDDVNQAVACCNVGGGHGGSVDHDAVAYGEGKRVSVHGCGGHAVGNGGSWNLACNNVVEQDVAEGCFAFWRVQICQNNARIKERLVRWGEDRERAVALEGWQQFRLNHAGHEGVVNASALSGAWNIVWCCGRGEHLVDDVDDTVAGVDICERDGGVVHHHAIANSEGDGVAVNGGCLQALGYSGGRNGSSNDVVEQDVREGCFSFRGIEGSQVNACVQEGLIGWSKERERPSALERFEQFCLNHCRDKRIVNSSALCRAGNVVWGLRGREHLIDDVDYTVACGNIGNRDRGAINHYGCPNREGEGLAVHGGCSHAFRHSGGRNLARHNVIEQDVGKSSLALRCIKGGQVNARIRERLICWSKEGERPSALERLEEFCLDHSRHERVVNSGALSRTWDVLRRIGWCKDLVDHVNQTVGGHNVGCNNGCVVHHDGISDGEGKRLTVGSVRHHAVGHVPRCDFSGNDVVKQNVTQCDFALRCVECPEVNACICERLVGWSKDGERACTLEGGEQIGLNNRSHKRIVNAGRLSGCWNVERWWGKNGVNDVDDSVGCQHISGGNSSASDCDDAVADSEIDVLTVDHLSDHSVADCACRNLACNHVVEENISEGSVLFRSVKVSQIDTGIGESLVGWGKDSEGPCSLEGGHEVGMSESGNQRVVNTGCCSVCWYVLSFVCACCQGEGRGKQ